ncbi:MAG: gamma carbonic anhydrase family protein [Actinomycetia bacterium]|nr:gamma carbonic anhydrase family protein [Actinomycetes bacterium]MCP4959761.1 gamma carbonic anhydrase family protein [Actinomycetes bacterium]
MPIYALGDQEPTIDPTAYVHPDAVVIGSVTIGAESTVWPTAVLRGDDGEIRIGERTSIQDGAVLHTTLEIPTIVGDDCTVGHCAHLEGCTIENGALVGSNSTVLHEAVVGGGALVGANALVPGGMYVPERAMALGVPAKIRPDAVDPDLLIVPGAQSYTERGKRYRTDLRRIG